MILASCHEVTLVCELPPSIPESLLLRSAPLSAFILLSGVGGGRERGREKKEKGILVEALPNQIT
jgi:hypothetical protein